MHFQPSSLSYGNDYGIFGLSKAERRDKKLRQEQKRLNKYDKCIAKGKGSKCDKYKRRAERKSARAETLDEKLYAKGKGKSLIEREERKAKAAGGEKGKKGARGGPMMASLKVRSGEAAAPEEMPIEDAEMMAEPTGGGGMLLPMIGLLMVGGIGFFVWKRKKG
jgi:LPXTG-motif cell wall-anchored protein